jgi:hypothetical protein
MLGTQKIWSFIVKTKRRLFRQLFTPKQNPMKIKSGTLNAQRE